MEKLRLDLIKDSEAVAGEDDVFYEEIAAPKFVDFTAPDRSRPDDRSWFCSRVGCDQAHEEVDPDALYRSFRFRVMAARSPNVRLRKALDRQAPSSIPKCPQSAPAKSAKSKMVRSNIMTSIPQKMAKAKLKDHPISSLRSSPSQINAKTQHCVGEKALTTPRSQKCAANREGFRSVKHQKEPVGVVKNKIVAKALFADTSKERCEKTNNSPASEVCAEMKKLKVGSVRTRNVPSRYLCISTTPKSSNRAEKCAKSSNRAEETNKSSKLKKDPASKICNHPGLQGTSRDNSNDTETDGNSSDQGVTTTDFEEHIPSLAKTDSSSLDNSRRMKNCEKGIESKIPVPQASSKSAIEAQSEEKNATELDDNKENALDTNKGRVMNSNFKNNLSENLQSSTIENVPQKVLRPQSKSSTEHSDRGGKHKRTTNPRPFRLRIDERGIIKEANQKRRLQIETQVQKENKSILRPGEGIKVTATYRSNSGRPAENKLPTSNQCKKAVVSKDKIAEKDQSRLLKVALLTQAVKSVTAPRKPPVSGIGRENNEAVSATVTLKCKRPATVPKEPKFQRMHLPKGCSKRTEVQR